MLRIALAQLRPEKGEYARNLQMMQATFRELAAWANPPHLVILPESALTGYFLEGGVRELALPSERLFDDLVRQHGEARAPEMDIAIGFYEVWRNRLYNSGLYATLGGEHAQIHHVHRKVFLPTYGVFDEERFVESGDSVRAFDTSWGRAAILICEDAWHSVMPTLAALDGAQLIIIPSATPGRGLMPESEGSGRPANLVRWERITQDIASEHGVYVAVSQLVGFEGGKGFAGGSTLTDPRGRLAVRGPVFEPALLAGVVDFDEITRARADSPLLADLEVKWPHLIESARGDGRGGDQNHPPSASPRVDIRTKPAGAGAPARAPAAPLAAKGGDPLAIDAELTRQWLVAFIRDEVVRRRGFEKGIVGLSGGVDSSLVAFLAAEALGPSNLIGVRMPYRSSSPESLSHAQLVVDELGIDSRTVEISDAVDHLVSALDGDVTPHRRGNIMARTRMITLFDLSAALKALPLGTGNKTERLFGYFTWHADDSPPVNPIGDLFKSQVWQLARHIGVPEVIITKPATADLIRGQTDEEDLGISYPTADAILHWLLQGYHASDVVARGFSQGDVDLVRERLESTHWKRRLPTVAMLSQTAIGEYYLRPVDY